MQSVVLAQEAFAFVKELMGVHGVAPPPPNSLAMRQLQAASSTLHSLRSAAPDKFDTVSKQWPGLASMLPRLFANFPAQGKRGAKRTAAESHTDEVTAPAIVPAVDVPKEQQKMLLLPEQMRAVLASLLVPVQRQQCRLLFNSDMHGKSFSTCIGKICDQGATFVVVRTRTPLV